MSGAENIVSFLLSYIKASLIPRLSPSPLHSCSCRRPSPRSVLPPAQIILPRCLSGSKLEQTQQMMRQGEGLCSAPSPVQPRTGNNMCNHRSVSVQAREGPALRSRGRSGFVCVCRAGIECVQTELSFRSPLTGLRLSLGGSLLYGVTVLWVGVDERERCPLAIDRPVDGSAER